MKDLFSKKNIFFFFSSFLFSFLIKTDYSYCKITTRGEVRVEYRQFQNDNNEETVDSGIGIATRIELNDKWKNFETILKIFSRVDGNDNTRDIYVIEDLYQQFSKENSFFFAGYRTINWSRAEAFHPTDVINTRNLDSQFENPEKIGELMIGMEYTSGKTSLTAFMMPQLQTPRLPQNKNRSSFFPKEVKIDRPLFLNNNGNFVQNNALVPQWAIRGQFLLNNFEASISWVKHFDRTDLKIVPNLSDPSVPLTLVLTPVSHFGFSANYVFKAFIFKTEAVYRNFQNSISLNNLDTRLTQYDYSIVATGLEYSLSFTNGNELNGFVEHQQLFGILGPQKFLTNIFQNDFLIGVRYAFNDAFSKQILTTLTLDSEGRNEYFFSATYSQRISDYWTLKVGTRLIHAPPQDTFDFSGLRQLNKDNQFFLELTRFF